MLLPTLLSLLALLHLSVASPLDGIKQLGLRRRHGGVKEAEVRRSRAQAERVEKARGHYLPGLLEDRDLSDSDITEILNYIQFLQSSKQSSPAPAATQELSDTTNNLAVGPVSVGGLLGGILGEDSSTASSASETAPVATVAASGATVTASVDPSTLSTSAPLPSASSNSSASIDTVTPTGKLAFAHFMVGVVSSYVQSDWEKDMSLAKAYGIDGFALNIGTDPYTDQQLTNAYAAAEATGFLVFISFDFNWFSTSNTGPVIEIVNKFIDQPAQFRLPSSNAAYVSTFAGDGFNWQDVISATGKNLYVVPNWQPSENNVDASGVSGLFSWYCWPSENNRAIDKPMDTLMDLNYLAVTQDTQKIYMAPVSPWFFTHFGTDVSYSKNWLFKSETLWYDRWEQILQLGSDPSHSDLQYIEIVTWNDYGESHYVGPYDTPHSDDGSSKWAADMPHDALLEFAKPYIAAFKAGQSQPTIEKEMLIYWYRPTLKAATCDGSDNCGSPPDGWDMVSDTVFAAAFTTSSGSVTVTSGGNTVTKQVGNGVTMLQFDMAAGDQSFSFSTSGGTSLSGTSPQPVLSSCWNGIYNFNIYSGMLS